MGHAVVNHTVFIDECGYYIWTAQSQGRALRGERAYRQVCGQRGRNVPPYSPFLNIVEQAVSALKPAIKADISRPEIQVQMNAALKPDIKDLPWEITTRSCYVKHYRHVGMDVGTITVAKCGQWFRFMQTYLPRCINNEAIER